MPPDRDLDRQLRDLGPHVEYPPVPDLAGSVRGRLEAESESTGSPARTRPQVWWIAAAALLLLVAVPVVSLAVRSTGGGASSGAGGGVAVESGGREAGDADPTRLTEDAAAGPTNSAEEDGSGLAVGAGEGTPSSMAAESGGSAASASAACGWPESSLEARPGRGAPGEEFGIRGRGFEADVRDCDEDPARDVRLEFLQDGRTWKLGSVDASKGWRLAAKLEVPTEARPGRATVRATHDQRSPEEPHGRASVEARFFVTK